jgi:alpha-L-rhamnosidase
VAFINGERITDDVFVPVVSDYNNTAYYNVYDVKDLLNKGKNTIGVTLGNGRYFSMIIPGFKSYGIPSLYSQLEVEYADGEKQTFVSDETWKVTSKGPIVANNEFMGEEYDANKEMPGWNKNGFDDSSWAAVDLMTIPAKRFLAQQNPPMRVQDEITPTSIVRRSDGAYIIDMGQNMVGWLDISLIGKKDSTISMRFAEILNPDTTLYLANLRRVRDNYDKYTPSKDGKFEWEPNFTYHGFRFVEVKGLDYEPSVKDFTGKVVYDKMKTTGSIETSNPLVNQIHKNAYWGIRSNYRGMPTDCPQRDERLGWLGDRATGCYGESYIFDNALLYEKWMQDIEDGMDEEGRIPSVAPTQWTILPGDITWPSAFFYAADMIRTKFGDERPIKKYYPAMKRFVEFVKNNTMENYIVLKDQYGDWCMPPESQELIHSKDPARKTAPEVLSTTVFYDLLNKMKGYAVIAGCPDDTTEYAELATNIKDAYNKKFFDPETGRYDNNTVTANILSLRLGLVPEGYEQKVVDNIVEKTNVDFDGHVSTGVLGIQHLMRGLTETGNLDLAYKILTNDTYPSWGYMVKNGATTIWELWNGNTADPAMNSGNHVMLLGDLIVWYYENLAGIKNAPGSTAFKDIVISPVFPEGLDMVDASFDSPYGPIKSHWSNKDGKLKLDVTVPGNASALVRLPENMVSLDAIKAQLGTVEGVEGVTSDAGEVAVKIGSGTYHFE